MSLSEGTNVARTYFEMSKEMGLSDREAVKQICECVGLKFAGSYANDWPNITEPFRAVPPAVVKEMQRRVAVYAAKKIGVKSTPEKLEKYVEMLSPKVKNN